MSLIGISCKPENRGFWYKIVGPAGSKFWAKYQAIGSSGHQTVGTIEGTTMPDEDWRYLPVHFEVMFAAVSEFEIDVQNLEVDTGSYGERSLGSFGERRADLHSLHESSHSFDEEEFETYSSPYIPYS